MDFPIVDLLDDELSIEWLLKHFLKSYLVKTFKTPSEKLKMFNKILSIVFIIGLVAFWCATVAAGNNAKSLVSTIHFVCDGKGEERIYLWESQNSRALFNIPWEGPYRNVDLRGDWIYKFDLRGAKRAEVDLKVGNSYLIHLSSDGKRWRKILDTAKTIGGLANLRVRTLDLTPFLTDGFVYLKFEDAVKTDGFGPCLFSVTVRSDLGDGSKPKTAQKEMPHFVVNPFHLQAGKNEITGQITNPNNKKVELLLHFELRLASGKAASEVQNIEVQPKSSTSFKFQCPVNKAGRQLIILSLYRRAELLQRESLTSDIPQESFILMSSVSKQPYYSTEQHAKVSVTVKASQKLLKQLSIHSALLKGEKNLQSLKLKPDEKGKAKILYPIESLVPGDYAIDVALVDENNMTIDKSTHEIHILPKPDKVSIVKIDENGILWVDGKKRFPLNLFLAEPDEQIAAAGFDGVVFGAESAAHTPDALEKLLKTLDRAEKLGVKAIPHICDFFRGKEDYDGLRTVVSRIKDSPALLCWYLADEPTGWATLPETLKKAKEIIHEIDPNHPVLVLSNDRPSFEAYVDSCDVFLSDPYPIPDSSIDMVADWTEACRRATGDRIPVWMCLQAHGPPWYGRYPTPVEIRNMAYQAIIHGALGLHWWAYGPMRQSGHWETYVKLVKEIRALEPVLLNGKSGKLRVIKVDGGHIHALTRYYGDLTYIFAVSVSKEPLEYSFKVKAGQNAEVMFEKRTLKVQDGEFKDPFQAYEVHVYRIRGK